jgi:hypothetical protein
MSDRIEEQRVTELRKTDIESEPEELVCPDCGATIWPRPDDEQ